MALIPNKSVRFQSEKSDKKKPDMREISTQTSLLYASSIPLISYNPDDLIQKKGLLIYKKMREDDQIKAVLTMKKYAVLANPWTMISASSDSQDKEIAGYIKDQLDGMEGNFEDCLMNVLTAMDYGFSITEVVYKIIEKGKWAGKVGLKKLATREPFNYDFDLDEHGNLKPEGIVFQGNQRYPQDKFIIFAYNKEFSNWYGRSDLRSAYRSWWSKEVLIRFHNMYMERFGMPTTVGAYKKGLAPEEVTKLRNILENLQAKYSITIPDEITISLLKSEGGEVGFHTAIEMHNKFIARSILVPDLLGYTEHAGGAYALGKKQFDVFLWILKKLSRDIEENIVGEQLVKKLVDYNWNVDKYPQFQFQAITEEDTEAKARIIRLGVDGGFINPEEPWVRQYLNLPQLTEGFILPKPKTIEGAPAGMPQPQGKAPETGEKGKPDGDKGVPDEDLWISALGPKKMGEDTIITLLNGQNIKIGELENAPVRCPYPACGSDEIKLIDDNLGTKTYLCLYCNNWFKITPEGEVYFYEKGMEEWIKKNNTLIPRYFTLKVKNYSFNYSDLGTLKNKLNEAKKKGLSGNTRIEVVEIKT